MGMALLTDLESGKVYLLDGGGSIGKANDNDIVLKDEAVSEHHAKITNTGSAWYITDCSSGNGVEMNGFRVPSVGQLGLREGCDLKLGNTHLRFSTDPEAINKYSASQKKAGKRISDRLHTKPRNKKRVKIISAVAAVVVLVLVLYLTNLFGVFDAVYHSKGNKNLSKYDCESALEAYRKCKNDSQAEINAEILQKIMENDYYEAAVLAESSINSGSMDVSRELWLKILIKYINISDSIDINQALSYVNARKILSENTDSKKAFSRSSFNEAASFSSMIDPFESSSQYWCAIDSLSDFYEQCGENCQGKFLILAQSHSYPPSANKEDDLSQAVSLTLMELLPERYLPLSLDEVEYVVLVKYDYREDGQYMMRTKALREYAVIETYQFPGPELIDTTSKIEGEPAPYSFEYSGSPPRWKSGGAPNMGEEIYSTIYSIICSSIENRS